MRFERISWHPSISEFSHDPTTNIRDSRALPRILEGVGWSDSPDFVYVVQGSRRDNVSASFLQPRKRNLEGQAIVIEYFFLTCLLRS
jgi:hypothetical protein